MESKKHEKSLLTKLILLVILIWTASTFIILFSLDNWADRETFGDLFGAVNALFSGLAFAGLIYTIYLQKQDLILQRNEIALNRTELKKSAKALVEQVEQMKISAKLNAMNTLINYFNIQISNPNNSEEIIIKTRLKRRETIQEIDKLIYRVSDLDLE